MVIFWKLFLTILILYTIGIDGNRARRRRQVQISNSLNQPPDRQILNAPPQQANPNDIGTGKQAGRQYYSPYQGQYGSIQGLNYPYAGAGVGQYNYGTGQYGSYGSYGGSYNQYPGSYGGYGGYGSGSYYNRPGSSNYYPSYGGNYYGGYYWNNGQKQQLNIFTVFLSSLLTLIICLITN